MLSMSNEEILAQYIPLVEFLGSAMGPFTEVVLNDLSNPQKAVIAIKNGHLSGRTIGSSATDFAVSILMSDDYKSNDYAVHYKGTANGKIFVSSTYYIKNPDGELIGMLCINTDTSVAQDYFNFTKRFLSGMNFESVISGSHVEGSIEENLNTPISALASSIIMKTCEKYGIPPERMTREEKMEIVRELSKQGVAGIKGAVAEIARQLSLSESTVYRYIALTDKQGG